MEQITQSSTVIPERDRFFTSQKQAWWDFNSFLFNMHQVNFLILNYLKHVLQKEKRKNFQNITVLDVGCGGGILAEPLARAGAKVVGIDINKEAIESAQTHAKRDPCLLNGIYYKRESIQDHCKTNTDKYDIVLLNSVLHHTQNHDLLIQDCVRSLKPGGIILLSWFVKTFECWWRMVGLWEIILRRLPRGTLDWNCCCNVTQVLDILQKNDCEVRDIRGLGCESFSGYWKWTDSLQLMSVIYAIKK